MIGQSLSHFKIKDQLGEGGMGVVYLAEDTRLARDVAIKILPAAVADDEQRLARFQREARVLASLSHPNIAALYEVGEAGGVHFLAMERVTGQDLSERLAAGPLSVTEALDVAIGIAGGLEAAHERGIVHRDLKPGNVMVDAALQTVKLLDFGLATAHDAPSPDSVDLTRSPTLTGRMTQAGVVLGTAAYMSPEQARGLPVDRRADLWAFGCILYEMLCGRAPFPGRDSAEIMAAVIGQQPDLDSLPPQVPAALRHIIRRCLHKESHRRLRDIGDLRLQLEEMREQPATPASTLEGASARGRTSWLPWLLTAIVVVASLTLALLLWPAAPAPTPERRFAIDLPWHAVPNWSDFRVALSPTGNHIAHTGRRGNRVDAYVRSLNSLESRPLMPSQESTWMAFSPDGAWLAVMTDYTIARVPLEGGQPQPVATLDPAEANRNPGASLPGLRLGMRGISWGPEGDFLIGSSGGLLRVDARGQSSLWLRAPEDEAYLFPHHLPDGKHALVSIFSHDAQPEIGIVSLAGGTLTRLHLPGSTASYAPGGYLLVRQGTDAAAVPFDPDTLTVQGEPVRILQDVHDGPFVAADGTMVYVPGRGESNARLVWTDRSGRVTPVDGERRNYSHLDLGLQGNMALLNIDADVFAMNLKQGTRRLLASDGALFPILDDRDQMAIIFSGSEGIFQQPAEGGQDVQTLVRPVRGNASGETGAYPVGALVPTSWNAATGDLALFDDTSDIWVRRADGALHTFLNSDAHERTGRFSPDGRWLAYVSNETGDYQVYVTAYPGPGRTLAVSIDGGLSPIWAPDQKALFFRNGGQVLMARITGGGELAFEPPERLFAGPYTVDLMGHQRWDVAPDGERFLMVESSEDFRIVIVENGVFGAAQTPRASR